MIRFECSNCATKFKVDPRYAGRQTKCPTCKKSLTVPTLEAVADWVPPEQIDGMSSSLAQLGQAGGVSLREKPTATAKTTTKPAQSSVTQLLARSRRTGQRYVIEGELGRGGMGAVLRAVDADVRREVAIKFMLDDKDPRKKARFVEEAQITGQLAHPNIVPIYDLGVDSKGRLFFSMKKVEGRSLAEILNNLRQEPRTAEKEYTLSRLLTVLINVCNALAYAHTRGVVHRDLKPANIMLGDFGEVYLMDWGLARVLSRQGEAAAEPRVDPKPGAARAAHSQAVSAGSRPSKVVTDRGLDSDLTQEGAVVGTPVYMPPEQANGKIGEIDQRSDVYSLGAILYEILTLQPPVEKEGGYLSVLMRVTEGAIVAPDRRAPDRNRKGKIPRELSAVAMKALAKEPGQRYQTVEALRGDIELYLEGRSVSAKEYAKWELLIKLMKRNKVASIFTAVLAMTLLWNSWANFQARRETDRAYQAYRQQILKSVPAFMEAAQLSVERQKLDNALSQVSIAVESDPSRAAARLLKGQILIARKDFSAAKTELDKYLDLEPNDADARELAKLCAAHKGDDPSMFFAFADVFRRQKADALVEAMYQLGGRSVEARKQILADYQRRIAQAWPAYGGRLSMDAQGRFVLDLTKCADVKDLKCLERMQLNSLSLHYCGQVLDLGPLKGMPLAALNLGECGRVRDLGPLKECPLTSLVLAGCSQVQDLRPLAGMRLAALNLQGCAKVEDLTPIRGMPLTSLHLSGTRNLLKDLEILRGMPLATLDISGYGQVRDLTPLQGMSITTLHIHGTGVTDLTPLEGMSLRALLFTPAKITRGMDVIRRMKSLQTIDVAWPPKLSSADFWILYDAGKYKK